MAQAGRRRRLDQIMVERGLAESRTRAQAMIMAGHVFAGDHRLDKPGTLVATDAPITVKGPAHPWVSRGGLKLVHALDHFHLDPKGSIAIDLGASTGGFTDVLITRGAQRVYAVDVGFGQLAWKLRNDPRVVVLERLNCRTLDETHVPDLADLLVADLSFIGLATALPAALERMATPASLVVLVKPQFEAGPKAVGKGGIVRDPDVRRACCERIRNWIDEQAGWQTVGLIESPITGAEGNIEYLLYAETKTTDDRRA